MTGKKKMRKRLFVDPKVQGALVLHVVLYWAVCVIAITLMLLCWQIFTGPVRMFSAHLSAMWFRCGPALVAALILLPVVIADVVRLSNRFAGPLLRVRRSMGQLARGDRVDPIEFRDGDFWQEFAAEFNAVLARVDRLSRPPGPEPREESDEESLATAAN